MIDHDYNAHSHEAARNLWNAMKRRFPPHFFPASNPTGPGPDMLMETFLGFPLTTPRNGDTFMVVKGRRALSIWRQFRSRAALYVAEIGCVCVIKTIERNRLPYHHWKVEVLPIYCGDESPTRD